MSPTIHEELNDAIEALICATQDDEGFSRAVLLQQLINIHADEATIRKIILDIMGFIEQHG